mmetsp:Transcript_8144/g.15335  ORF Transcript_8144/g.15335 Transcript_8144/m.15335 type:complete len:297 (-) Transcript_8144:1654-2544(-)
MATSPFTKILVLFYCCTSTAFSFSLLPSRSSQLFVPKPTSSSTSLSLSSHHITSSSDENYKAINRRNFLSCLIATSLTLTPGIAKADIEGVVTPSFSEGPPTATVEQGVKLYTTKSGLKYIVLQEAPSSTAPSPRYGQLLTISYKSYIKLPKSDLQSYDSDRAFLIKHGNGRIIPGLDEGLHTMKLGEVRRIIIPPKLGYIGPGVLGPLPASPLGRFKLNRLLEEMVEARGGNIVIDVELKNILDDEADQGYYEDESISPEDFNTLRNNLSEKARQARDDANNGGANTAGGLDLSI